MVKIEKVPIQWKEEKHLYCDCCGSEMTLIDYYYFKYNEYEMIYHYCCGYCGTEIKTPKRFEEWSNV